MKAAQKYFLGILIASLLVVVTGIAQMTNPTVAPINNLGAIQNGSSIRVTWKSTSETGIKHYELYRSTDINGTFNDCVRDDIATLGDYHDYLIEDNCDLFKTEGSGYYYKVRAVYSADGSIGVFSEIVFARYNSTSSTAKRTWGSIKAMFR